MYQSLSISRSVITVKKTSARTPQTCPFIRHVALLSGCNIASHAIWLIAIQRQAKFSPNDTYNIPFTEDGAAAKQLSNWSRNTPPILASAFSTIHAQRQQIAPEEYATALPICCPGCGAFSQTIEPEEPGYYSRSRKQTRKLLALRKTEAEGASEVGVKDSLDIDELAEEPAVPKPLQGMLSSITLFGFY